MEVSPTTCCSCVSCLECFEANYVPSAQYHISPEAMDAGNGDETEGS